jgi:hypothetical protein
MALSKLSSAFNLKATKGHFPHKKNTSSLYEADVEEDFPGIEFFEPDFMSEAGRAEVLEWHAEQIKAGARFRLREAMLFYCRQDVNLLR